MLIAILIAYFLMLFGFSRAVSKRGGNAIFYRGERKSSWLLVAYGMIGASLSGVSFVSVPGLVATQDLTYLQMCLGFIAGYFIVAFVLLPLYYKFNLTSIYALLDKQSGVEYSAERKVAALFFLISDLLGSGVKFFLVCIILQRFIFDDLGVSFLIAIPAMIAGIWLYTRRGGVKTLVYTDVLQTTLMLAAAALLIWQLKDAFPQALNSEHWRTFEFADFKTTQNFWKQFITGAFIVVVMTGLNQNMMQKNLTCKTLREAQKDMCVSGFFFVPVNLLFLVLGILLLIWIPQNGLSVPAKGDELLPFFVENSGSRATLILFVLGIVSAAFSSADSALTALTTSACIDLFQKPDDERLRERVHFALAIIFVGIVYALYYFGTNSLLNLVYVLVSYTYGPLLGLFGFALLKKKVFPSKFVPVLTICLFAPIICYALNAGTLAWLDYKFGYELLLINGALAFAGLVIYHTARERENAKSHRKAQLG